MGENLINARGDLQRVLDLLKEGSLKTLTSERRDILTRVQIAQNTLIQNERKIWLRTKEGKEMLRGFGDAASELLDAAMKLGGADAGEPENLKKALEGVELQARRLEEESRNRSMIVT